MRGLHEAAPADRISPRRSIYAYWGHNELVIVGVLKSQALKERGRVFQAPERRTVASS